MTDINITRQLEKESLEYLISECGDGLNEIRRVTNGNKFEWEANTTKITPMIYYGHTPKSAVVKLLLALYDRKGTD
jgi:hypothetical protein